MEELLKEKAGQIKECMDMVLVPCRKEDLKKYRQEKALNKQRAEKRMLICLKELIDQEQFRKCIEVLKNEPDCERRVMTLMSELKSIDPCLAKRCVLRVQDPQSCKTKLATAKCICNSNKRALGTEQQQQELGKRTQCIHPVFQAISSRNESLVMNIVSGDPDICFEEDQFGFTPLLLCSKIGMNKAIPILIDRGSNLEGRDKMVGRTPLMWATLCNSINCVNTLLSFGADPNALSDDNSLPLLVACQMGSEAIVSALLMHNANLHACDKMGLYAAHIAASFGQTAILLILAQHQGDLNIQTCHGWSPVMMAARANHVETTLALAELGSPVNLKCNVGMTALHYAARAGHDKIIRVLLNSSNPNNNCVQVIDEISRLDGKSALMMAAEVGSVKSVKLLLDNGADSNLVDKDGLDATALAKLAGHQRCSQLLKTNTCQV